MRTIGIFSLLALLSMSLLAFEIGATTQPAVAAAQNPAQPEAQQEPPTFQGGSFGFVPAAPVQTDEDPIATVEE